MGILYYRRGTVRFTPRPQRVLPISGNSNVGMCAAVNVLVSLETFLAAPQDPAQQAKAPAVLYSPLVLVPRVILDRNPRSSPN